LSTTPIHAPPEPSEADAHAGDAGARRLRYHHGDLREALIAATHELVIERGGENFTLADACRVAGVSTAAPYKHFRDKQEILEIICRRGFDRMTANIHAAIATHGSGTFAAIVAIGHAYIDFARHEPALFRLMFGQHPVLKAAEPVDMAGQACFGSVIQEVQNYIATAGIKTDPRVIAVQLWTFVHGASCLLIDGDYAKVAPDIDVDALASAAAAAFLKPSN
jgi:AcrR family transcriptional regulator